MARLNLEGEGLGKNLFPPNRDFWHPEKARIQLAYGVLFAIFLVFISTFFVNHYAKTNYIDYSYFTELLELCKTGLLPIVTLILGYYFSKNS